MQQSTNGKAVTGEDPVNANTSDTHTEIYYELTVILKYNKARDLLQDPKVTAVIAPSITICAQYNKNESERTDRIDIPDERWRF